MKTIYLECNMGAAGDMLMSALYEICDQKEWFLHKMNTVFAPYHIALSPESAVSCGINGTHMKVTVDGTEEVSLDVKAGHAHHTHAESPDASGATRRPILRRTDTPTRTPPTPPSARRSHPLIFPQR